MCRLEVRRLTTATASLPEMLFSEASCGWVCLAPESHTQGKWNLARERLRKDPDLHVPSWGGFTLATYVYVLPC